MLEEDYIRQAIEPTPFDKLPKDQIAVKLIDALKTDKTYTKSEVKDLLQGIYKELNITENRVLLIYPNT